MLDPKRFYPAHAALEGGSDLPLQCRIFLRHACHKDAAVTFARHVEAGKLTDDTDRPGEAYDIILGRV